MRPTGWTTAAVLLGSTLAGSVSVPRLLSLRGGASESQQHYHNGILEQYDIGPPSIILTSKDESRLRSGKSVTNTITSDDGTSRRLVMVQDIQAPSNVVLGRIMDLNKYPEMVSGVDSLVTYASNEEKGVQMVKSTYEISALHMRFKYYIEHLYDPKANCMVFHLDYSRRSDIDDSVGYWYVEPTGRATARVFYSCECKLRGWVPGPVYNLLTKEALKKATVWVERESVKEWKASRTFSPGKSLVRFVDDMRERVDGFKLPQLQLPQPQWKPSDWIADRRQAATRFVNSARRTQKAQAMIHPLGWMPQNPQ